MISAGRRWLLWCALPLTFAAGKAQTLVGEFVLNRSLNNNVAGGAALVSLGGQITALGYVFAANQGLTFSSASLNSTSYTVELSFKFDSTGSWRKIVDFAGVAAANTTKFYDTGLYSLSGALQLYPESAAAQTDIAAGVTVDVVITRDGTTGAMTGYVNGQQRFSFNDATTQYGVITAPGNTLTFFADDFYTSQAEASGGTASFIRIYNGALSASDVSALYAAGAPVAVPEPATWALLGLGAAVAARCRRRG